MILVHGASGPTIPGIQRHHHNLPRGSYPTPLLGYLFLWFGSVILKSRRPKKGVGYEPLGTIGLGSQCKIAFGVWSSAFGIQDRELEFSGFGF